MGIRVTDKIWPQTKQPINIFITLEAPGCSANERDEIPCRQQERTVRNWKNFRADYPLYCHFSVFPPPDSILCCGINVWGVEAININESRCHIVIIKLEGTRIKQISALQGDGGHYYSVSRAHHHIQYFIISVITGARHYRGIFTQTRPRVDNRSRNSNLHDNATPVLAPDISKSEPPWKIPSQGF